MPHCPSHDHDHQALAADRASARMEAAWYRQHADAIVSVVSGMLAGGAAYLVEPVTRARLRPSIPAADLIDAAADIVHEITARGAKDEPGTQEAYRGVACPECHSPEALLRALPGPRRTRHVECQLCHKWFRLEPVAMPALGYRCEKHQHPALHGTACPVCFPPGSEG